MPIRAQLEQIQQNRMRKGGVHPVSTMVNRLAGRLLERDFPVASAVATVLADVVDEEFRIHSRIGEIRGTTVTINVDHPALVYSMRTRWLRPVAEALRGCACRPPISKVVFAFGDGGLNIPSPQSSRREPAEGGR